MYMSVDIHVTCEEPVRPRTIVYEAPDPGELQRARERRIKELKMYDILREIILYVVYVWVIIVISYEFRDPNSFQFRENLRHAFVTGGRSTAVGPQTSLELVGPAVFLQSLIFCCPFNVLVYCVEGFWKSAKQL